MTTWGGGSSDLWSYDVTPITRVVNFCTVLTELCRFANAAGLRTQKALVEECVRIDPLTPITHCVVATYHSVNGLALEGVEAARRTIEMAPGASALHIFSAWQLAEAGLRAEAADVLGRVGNALEGTVQGSWALFLENALAGNVELAAEHAAQGLDRMRVDHWAHTIASAFALMGKTDDAVRWTAIAIDSGFINYPCLTQHDPFLESVRMHLEFQKLMESLKGRWEAVVAWERDNGL